MFQKRPATTDTPMPAQEERERGSKERNEIMSKNKRHTRKKERAAIVRCFPLFSSSLTLQCLPPLFYLLFIFFLSFTWPSSLLPLSSPSLPPSLYSLLPITRSMSRTAHFTAFKCWREILLGIIQQEMNPQMFLTPPPLPHNTYPSPSFLPLLIIFPSRFTPFYIFSPSPLHSDSWKWCDKKKYLKNKKHTEV